MTRSLALAVLRLYPREWRRRYEDEVVKLFDDKPPHFSDLPGLIVNAAGEWRQAIANPLLHTWLWLASELSSVFFRQAVLGIILGAVTREFGQVLRFTTGEPSVWFVMVGCLGFCAVGFRIYPAQAIWPLMTTVTPIKPLSPTEVKQWGGLFLVSALICQWSTSFDFVPMWLMLGVTSYGLFLGTPAAWTRGKSIQRFWATRCVWRDAVKGHASVVKLQRRGLATAEEVHDLQMRVDHLYAQLQVAASEIHPGQLGVPTK